jgi:hypothetical protein
MLVFLSSGDVGILLSRRGDEVPFSLSLWKPPRLAVGEIGPLTTASNVEDTLFSVIGEHTVGGNSVASGVDGEVTACADCKIRGGRGDCLEVAVRAQSLR